jgi:thiol-disulfide isomerase/thioredoxin
VREVSLALLVYRLVHDPGAGLARAVKAHRTPPAPNLRLAVIWPHAQTWPRALRPVAARKTLQLSDLRGYPVVVNFWASWCSPCNSEAGLLASAAQARRRRVVFVGIDVHDFTSDARSFLRAHHVPYVAVHAGSSIAQRFGLIGLPETFYVDRRGRIQDMTRGELSTNTLEGGLNRASHDENCRASCARPVPGVEARSLNVVPAKSAAGSRADARTRTARSGAMNKCNGAVLVQAPLRRVICRQILLTKRPNSPLAASRRTLAGGRHQAPRFDRSQDGFRGAHLSRDDRRGARPAWLRSGQRARIACKLAPTEFTNPTRVSGRDRRRQV